jgi:hypothetical protein
MEKHTVDLSHVENHSLAEKAVSLDKAGVNETAFVAEGLEKWKKTPAERRLVLKTDLTVVPLAALIYFVAYLVSPGSTRGLRLSRMLTQARSGSKQHRSRKHDGHVEGSGLDGEPILQLLDDVL